MSEQSVDRIQALRDALAAHIAYSKQTGRSGTELPWCWSDTGDKSNDYAIGTAVLGDSDDAPMAEGYVDSARMDSMEALPIDEVCRAENASFADAALIVAAVNAAPELLIAADEVATHAATLQQIVEFCLDSRAYPHDRQAAGLRDNILTLIDPLMNITGRIREQRKAGK